MGKAAEKFKKIMDIVWWCILIIAGLATLTFLLVRFVFRDQAIEYLEKEQIRYEQPADNHGSQSGIQETEQDR